MVASIIRIQSPLNFLLNRVFINQIQLDKLTQHEEFRALYSAPKCIKALKLRMVRWAGHEEHMGKIRKYTKWKEVVGELI
jgi:hypothetical protein